MRLKKTVTVVLAALLLFDHVFFAAPVVLAALPETLNRTETVNGKEKTDSVETKTGYASMKASEVLARVSAGASFYGKKTAHWINLAGTEETVPEGARDDTKGAALARSANSNGGDVLSGRLPSAFDLRRPGAEEGKRLSGVKNQGAYGMCWTAAGLSAVESSILSQGLFYRKSWLTQGKLKLSMSHLGWYLFSRPSVGEKTEGDYLENPCRGAGGGDYTGVIAALSAGEGVQLEKNAPYEHWNYGQPEAARYASYYGLSGAYFLDFAGTQQARQTVKSWIYEKGAVEAGMYFFVQPEESCYYQELYDASHGNHEVVLVGWDDSYSKENFRKNGAVPEYDGAWIAQNSYGEEWGEGGYFYISYEEPSLAGFVSYEMEERRDGETCYQYDGIGGSLGVASTAISAAANVFLAEETKMLTEIGLFLPELNSSGADYKLNIYRWNHDVGAAFARSANLNGGDVLSGAPEGARDDTVSRKEASVTAKSMVNTGDLERDSLQISEETRAEEAETEGRMEYPGYQKISLKSPVLLKEGESFAVVLELSPVDQRSVVYYSFEGTIQGYDMDRYHYGYKKGQSYFLKGFGSQAEWQDVTEITKETDGFSLGNLNLKAFTTEIPEDGTGSGGSNFMEQKAQLSETLDMAQDFLETKDTENAKASFTQGNESYNEELLPFLEQECAFAQETLQLADGKLYELENAYGSLAAAMEYMKYPAEKNIQTPEELYRLSEETKQLSVNALNLVTLEEDLEMNPLSSFVFGRFDTEQAKGEKGVIQSIRGKVQEFQPIGGDGGVEFILDGNGHSISGLVCHAGGGTYSGLVGMMAGNGCIRNLTIQDSYLEGNFCTGAFAGVLAYGAEVKNCMMKNTFVRGTDSYDEMGNQVMARYTGGIAGLVTSSWEKRRSGIYDSGLRQSLVYGAYLTGGLMGAVCDGASAGTGNTIRNSSVAGAASGFSGFHSGVGMYFGGEAGNDGDLENRNDIAGYGMIVNGSEKEADQLFVNLYQPKKKAGKLFLFLEPYKNQKRVLEYAALSGTVKKKKRGKDYFQDGWQLSSIQGDITVVPVTKRSFQVNFYSPLTGKRSSGQTVVKGDYAISVPYPKLKGYCFLGWYDKNSGEKFRFSRKVTKNYELYPLYKKSK